ncbi:MAG TPA: transposase [Pirellulales bacterium]|nr:transposase [Pirellulales bacterium]
MPEPLAYFLTWTTYGSWLPGDERGWVLKGRGFKLPDVALCEAARVLLTETPCLLDADQRLLVEQTIRDHCRIRKWELHAVNCQTNHVHAVVAANKGAVHVRNELKAWCTRKLKERQAPVGHAIRENWWTEGGSQRFIGDQLSLEATVGYVVDGQ